MFNLDNNPNFYLEMDCLAELVDSPEINSASSIILLDTLCPFIIRNTFSTASRPISSSFCRKWVNA